VEKPAQGTNPFLITGVRWCKIEKGVIQWVCVSAFVPVCALTSDRKQVATKVGWEINVPFQHRNRLYRGQGLG